MYSQGVCRIRKPACAGNGCAIFPIFQTADWGQKTRRSAADDLFRVSFIQPNKYHKLYIKNEFRVLYQIKDDTVFVDWIVDCRQDYAWLMK